MEVFGIHLQLKAYIPSTYQFLLEQSYLYGQMYETPQELISKYQPYPEMTSIQVLHPPHCTVWILTVVLQ